MQNGVPPMHGHVKNYLSTPPTRTRGQEDGRTAAPTKSTRPLTRASKHAQCPCARMGGWAGRRTGGRDHLNSRAAWPPARPILTARSYGQLSSPARLPPRTLAFPTSAQPPKPRHSTCPHRPMRTPTMRQIGPRIGGPMSCVGNPRRRHTDPQTGCTVESSCHRITITHA